MADGFMTQPVVQETELVNDFMPEWAVPEVAVPQAEPAGDFMPEPEVPGWDMAESISPESSSRTDSMALFLEDTVPTKIYEPKRHKKESGSDFTGTVPAFQETEQTDKAGGDWMIYG